MKAHFKASIVYVILLALPFILTNVWLASTVPPFGASDLIQGVVFGLALATLIWLLARCLGWFGLLLGLALYLADLLLVVADAVSWFMQGSSFNERFFAHFDLENFRASFEAYGPAMAVAIAGIILIAVGVAYVLRRTMRPGLQWWSVVPIALLGTLIFMLNAPPGRLYAYFAKSENASSLANSPEGKRILGMLDTHPTSPGEIHATRGRNLVFIYMESLERTYTNQQRFPGLTPNINRLRHQGLDFSGFETFPGVTYTISGIFSSQCGAPYLIDTIFGGDFGKLGFVPNNDNTKASTFHPELACLGDVLHAAGYDQTYLSGVELDFANTGTFFRMHHYDHVLGKRQIEKRHGGKLPTEGWGLLDDDMFSEVLADYKHREALGKPFSIVMSTIDTHPPEGYVLPGCTPYHAIKNAMLNAVHCADHMVGQFIDKLSQQPDWANTVVVVMSDHVSMRNVASPLYPPDNQRQPLLFILNAGHGERPARMYHMDIAPTVLAAMGVKSNVQFMAGADRGEPNSPSSKLPADPVAKAVLRNVLWQGRKPIELCKGGSLVAWSKPNNLMIGGQSLPVMLGGYPVSSIHDTRNMLVFVNKYNAQLQMLSRGESSRWVEQVLKSGGGVFKATPFWNDAGHRMLALDWISPTGAWASLGQVSAIHGIHLETAQCHALMDELYAAKTGTRLDFSAALHTEKIPETREPRPGFVVSSNPPTIQSPGTTSAFMFGRLTRDEAGYGTVHINVKDRISIMPGQDKNASAEFDVEGLASLQLEPRIDNLFGACIKRQDTGIVGIRMWLDGQSLMPRFIVDRHYHHDIDIDTAGHHRLRIEVDKGNTTSACDYFALGFSGIVPTPDAKKSRLAVKSP